MIEWRWVSILLLLPAASARSGEADGFPSVISRAPYVQRATPTSISVVWRTAHRIEPVVRYGRDLEMLTERALGTNILTRVALGTNTTEIKTLTNRWPELAAMPKLHSAPAGTFQYEALLSGLAPDTVYYYAVFDGEVPLTDRETSYRFRTHPAVGTARPVRFWVVGDSSSRRQGQYDVYTAMLDYTTRQNRPIDFLLHVGDMAYWRGRDIEFQTRFFEVYAATLRDTVCWPTLGNHEGATSKGSTGIGPYFDAYVCPTNGEAGGVPSGTESYYAFDYGRVHVVSLNTADVDRRPTAAMAKWLKRDLAACPGKTDWLIAFFHHAPYTKGTHDSDRERELMQIRAYLLPILESAGVDLVLTGHSHIYERSMLMDGAYATPTVSETVILDDGDGDPKGDGPYRKPAGLTPNAGTVQIVTGHGGNTMRRKATMPVMSKTILEYGSVIVDVSGDTLTGTMLDRYGDTRDTFSIVKGGGRPSPMRLTYPRLPPAWKPAHGPGTEDPFAEPPEDYIALIPENAQWQYLAGEHPDGDAWTKPGFEAKDWKVGQAGFGYGGENLKTLLPDMKGEYSVVYIRNEFEVEQADQISDIGLMIDYDDAFIAYLNGKEVLRKGVGKDHGRKATDVKARKPEERGKVRYYPLKDPEKNLKNGVNVLAIEGHNARLESSAFVLDPYLILED